MTFTKKAGLDPTAFLTTVDAGKITGLDRGTIRRAIIAGQLDAFQTPAGKYLIPASSLDEWLQPVKPAA